MISDPIVYINALRLWYNRLMTLHAERFFAENPAAMGIEERLKYMDKQFRGCRPHHAEIYKEVVQTVKEHPEMSMVQVALWRANYRAWREYDDRESFMRDKTDPAAPGEFRDKYDLDRYDETLPGDISQDYIGFDGQGVEYRDGLAADFFAFLTAPGDARVPIGRIKDGICDAAACGVHCFFYNTEIESQELNKLINRVEMYLREPKMFQKIQQNPDLYTILVDGVAFSPSEEIQTDRGPIHNIRLPRDANHADMSLGLFRDFLTYHGTYGKYWTFDELLAAREVEEHL